MELKANYIGKHSFSVHRKGASAPPANRGALCSQTVGHTAGSLMLWPLSSHHPFQDIKQPTYRGPPTWLPFLPSNVASSSIVFGQPVGVPQQKLSWSPFITREWMMLDSASPASIPCCTLPPFSRQSCFHFSSHQCLSLCGICQKFPLLPLLFTDPSLTTHFL